MYDCLIIGAGMSGLAAGIRLAMFGQRVCILERHYAVGGLNSYYRLEGRNYDVGLHALTNFAPRGAKSGPLPRLLRQLRLSWDDFELAEQNGSTIDFPEARLKFNNDPALLVSEIERAFPSQSGAYQQFLRSLLDYNELQHEGTARSAREMLAGQFSDPLLTEMLLCPVLFYGGPREHDIDWGSFCVLFRSIFLEGLARPRGGIRVILKHLTKRFKQLGGELRLRAGVREIAKDNSRAAGVVLDDGMQLAARYVISSAGWNETVRLCKSNQRSYPGDSTKPRPSVAPGISSTPSATDGRGFIRPEDEPALSGRLTFVESICTLDCQPRELDFNDTIVFYSTSERFHYVCPNDFADLHSGIVCSPNNYRYEEGHGSLVPSSLSEDENLDDQQVKNDKGPMTGDSRSTEATCKVQPKEGTLRLTALANYDRWAALGPEEYQSQKREWHRLMVASAQRFVPDLAKHIVASDTFTPKTIVHFTGHDCGAVYGAPQKRYDAKTHLDNLLICGADQGFVGIIGTLTSGIQVANMLLRESN